jgi:Domain of unknown function (DUF4328)
MDPRYKSTTANLDTDESFTFQDLGWLTTTVKWLLWVGAVLALMDLVSSWMQLDLLSRTFTEAEGRANDMREGAIAGLALLVTLATLVAFGRWIVLAHRNLPALGAQSLEFRPGWAVGWYFIPIANLWKPYQAMKALWQYSQHAKNPDLSASTWILPTWWTFWLISNVLGNIIIRTSLGSQPTISQLIATTELGMANGVVDVILNIVAAILIGRIMGAQRRQHENPQEFAAAAGFADGTQPR